MLIILFNNIWNSFKKEPLLTLLFIFQVAVVSYAMFTACFELKYASDQLDMVNNAYANYYFYRYHFNYGGYEDPREIVFGSNRNGFVEKIDTATEELKSVDGLHIAVNITNSGLRVCDTLDSWDAEGCSESEYSLVQRTGDGVHTLWRQCFADKAYFDFFGIPRIASGRFFSDDEFKLSYDEGSTVPVLLGYDFMNYCEIGDCFDAVVNIDTNETVRICIIWFIEDGETFVDNNGSTLFSFNRVAVVPFCNRRYFEYVPRATDEMGNVYILYSLDYMNKFLLVEKNRKT